MNKDQLIRMRSYMIDSIKAWGPDNPLSAEADIWVADLDEEISSMPNKVVDYTFVAFTKVYVPDEEVTLRFYEKEAAMAFMDWWRRRGGDEAFTAWCLDNGLDHLVNND